MSAQNETGGLIDEDPQYSVTYSELVITPESAATPLPFMVDNSVHQYFPKVVHQAGGSCVHASSIGHMFTYETNRFRNEIVMNDEDWEHMYAPGFTYNFINHGSGNSGSCFNHAFYYLRLLGVPRASDYENVRYLKKLDDPTEYDFKRFLGSYDWYKEKVMTNKPTFDIFQLEQTASDSMIWKMKHWLNDHNHGDSIGGTFLFSANLLWANQQRYPLPEESYAANQYYIHKFTTGGHAMTVVGYCDSIKVDYDSNGVFTNHIDINGDGYVNVKDWEIGAFKVASSSGTNWANGGFVWVPYRLFAMEHTLGGTHSTFYFMNINSFNGPQLAYKIKEVSHTRYMAQWYVDNTDNAENLQFRINSNNRCPIPYYDGTADLDPLQGYSDTLEFGIEISYFINNNPGKFIFRRGTPNQSQILELSLIDYRFNETFELPFDITEIKVYDTIIYVFPGGPPTNYTIYYYDLNYDLIPFSIDESLILNSEMVSRFTPVVRNNSMLSIDNGVNISFYNSTISIENGSSMIVGNDVSLNSKKGDNKIEVGGYMEIDGALQTEVDIVVNRDGVLKVKSGGSLHLLNDAKIVINEKATIIIEDNATVLGSNTSNSIQIAGNMQLGQNVVFGPLVSGQKWAGIVFSNTGNTYTIQNAVFNGCDLRGECKSIDISGSNFTQSELCMQQADVQIANSIFNNAFIEIREPASKSSRVDINNCQISNLNLENAKAAVYIEDYPYYTISANTLENNSTDGIFISRAGIAVGDHRIADNTIKHHEVSNLVKAGIRLYNSYADITGNVITNNESGILCLNNSSVRLYGNEAANTVSQTQQIMNNLNHQVYATQNSFPVPFTCNAVIDEDNTQALVYYSTMLGRELDVAWNFWGNNFDPRVDLYPAALYNFEPIWELEYHENDDTEAEQMYKTAQNQMNQGDYIQAESSLQNLVQHYPETEFAELALKDMLPLEYFAGNDYMQLYSYYGSQHIQGSETLSKLASRLANQCQIILKNYPDAIVWFENVISNPETLEDSIFAIIDLEYTYLQMQNGDKGTYVGKLAQYIPKDEAAYRSHRDALMEELFKNHAIIISEEPTNVESLPIERKWLSSSPNPFTDITTISYEVAEPATVVINIYSITGQKLMSLVNEEKAKGKYSVEVNASNLPEGIYLYTLELDGKVMEKDKMVLTK